MRGPEAIELLARTTVGADRPARTRRFERQRRISPGRAALASARSGFRRRHEPVDHRRSALTLVATRRRDRRRPPCVMRHSGPFAVRREPFARGRRVVRGCADWRRLGSAHRRERQRLALQRHQRLAGHPRRRLVRAPRVVDVAVGGDQRVQVLRAATARRGGAASPGRRRPRSVPGSPNAVDCAFDPAPGWDGKPPSRSCWARMSATARDRARDAARAAPPASASSAAPGVVDVARRRRAVAKLKPPSASCWRTSHVDRRPAAGATPGRSQRQHRERRSSSSDRTRRRCGRCRARARLTQVAAAEARRRQTRRRATTRIVPLDASRGRWWRPRRST